eukprot:TRINITY_DN75651_c0_g1_i1.p1 TRINITY_DN75651_c0_g1~~TRINITY_DN75651_c0_g1_i1.p1  ORF type:complete len:686 (-),score=100.48 TRINITY_DN75651_c0_g1_i1:68-2125(-)
MLFAHTACCTGQWRKDGQSSELAEDSPHSFFVDAIRDTEVLLDAVHSCGIWDLRPGGIATAEPLCYKTEAVAVVAKRNRKDEVALLGLGDGKWRNLVASRVDGNESSTACGDVVDSVNFDIGSFRENGDGGPVRFVLPLCAAAGEVKVVVIKGETDIKPPPVPSDASTRFCLLLPASEVSTRCMLTWRPRRAELRSDGKEDTNELDDSDSDDFKPAAVKVGPLTSAFGNVSSDTNLSGTLVLRSRSLSEFLHRHALKSSVRGFPSPTGAFDWLWHYVPPALVPRGLDVDFIDPSSSQVLPERHARPTASVKLTSGSRFSTPPRGQIIDSPQSSTLVVTMNCEGKFPPADLLAELPLLFARGFPDKEGGSTTSNKERKAAEPPHSPRMVVVALQEVCPLYNAVWPLTYLASAAATAWVEALSQALDAAAAASFVGTGSAFQEGTKQRYELVFSGNLVGITLVIWVRDDGDGLTQMLRRKTQAADVPCGTFNLGNKGAVAASLSLGSCSVCVVAVHLAAGADASQTRDQNMQDILQFVRFHSHPKCVFEHDIVLLAGDMNSRNAKNMLTEPPTLQEETEITPSSFSSRQKLVDPGAYGDEVTRLKKLGRGIWGLLEEAPLNFAPTWKLEPGFDAYDASRTPSWCDRALWWVRPSMARAVPRLYDSVREVRFSDHTPVVLLLDIWTTP